MITLSLVLPCLVLALWWVERRDRTRTHRRDIETLERERVRQHQEHKRERANLTELAQRERTALMDRFDQERKEWANERTMLLNRIKPETAQPALYDGPYVAPPAVAMDDDDAFWESKEALAERLAHADLAER